MKFIFKSILVIVLLALGITSAMQAFTNLYHFSPARQFSGDKIYNPYQDIDTVNWKKANFHAHQLYMVGIDFEYTADEFKEAYAEQGYDIIGLSDHQQINKNGHIPSYEHGVGFNNYHLLMLGTEGVSWFNYPIMALPQHQMQYMLDKLKSRAKLLGINHASRHRFASVEVFDNLMGYDLMEMNPDLNATAWDRALSSGIYSTLIANDDAHSITDRQRWFQRTFTMVNTTSLKEDDIIKSLKEGRAYGVFVSQEQNQKTAPHKGLPTIKNISFINDTISITFSTKADSIKFIGQDAKVLATIIPHDSLQAVIYKFAPSDTYVRSVAFFPNGSQIWTNPFYRQGGSIREAATVNTLLTTLNSIGWGILTLIILWVIIKVLRRKKVDYDSYYRF